MSPLLGLIVPRTIFVVSGSFVVHRGVQVGGQHQALQFLHNRHNFFSWGPFWTCLDHVLAHLALVADVGVVDFGAEGDDGSFEGEVIEFELYLELSSFEG